MRARGPTTLPESRCGSPYSEVSERGSGEGEGLGHTTPGMRNASQCVAMCGNVMRESSCECSKSGLEVDQAASRRAPHLLSESASLAIRSTVWCAKHDARSTILVVGNEFTKAGPQASVDKEARERFTCPMTWVTQE